MTGWALFANVLLIGVLTVLTYALQMFNTQFLLGAFVGFWTCYVLYRCWRQDYEDEKKPHLIE